jgi:outer membrane receptor for ferrienterochelin and colicin
MRDRRPGLATARETASTEANYSVAGALARMPGPLDPVLQLRNADRYHRSAANNSDRHEGSTSSMRYISDPKRLLAGACVASLLVVGAASAQNAPAQDDQPLQEIVVSGFRSSLEKSLEAKRNSTNFSDSISAEDVGKLPDNNLAEAIARIPGVQISRTNGEGQQINLRGLGPSFTRVTLDGMPISVASEGSVDQAARNREFDFDLLPSDLFSALEVAKSPQASGVEGGLAGTVNLRPARPFDYDGLAVSYKLEGTYQSSSQDVDPRASSDCC